MWATQWPPLPSIVPTKQTMSPRHHWKQNGVSFSSPWPQAPAGGGHLDTDCQQLVVLAGID